MDTKPYEIHCSSVDVDGPKATADILLGNLAKEIADLFMRSHQRRLTGLLGMTEQEFIAHLRVMQKCLRDTRSAIERKYRKQHLNLGDECIRLTITDRVGIILGEVTERGIKYTKL